MQEQRPSSGLASPMIMFLSAAIFGYFGFVNFTLASTQDGGRTVFIWALQFWTLRVGAALMAACGAMSLAAPILGNLAYSAVGFLLAAAFVTLAVCDHLDQQYAAMLPPVIVLILGVWFAYGSWSGWQEARWHRRRAAEAVR